MKNHFIKITFLFITCFGFSQNYESKIDTIISSNYNNEEPGLTLIVAKAGKTIYSKAIGKSSLELNTPLQLNSVFQVGSITKQFTAVSILMLAEQGKLNIEDNIRKYIPEYSEIGKDITIHHLLNHTSGIKNKTPLSDKSFISRSDMTPQELIEYIKNEPLEFKPGEQFKYSNAGYILLGKIIEVVTEQSYKDFIENTIFKKLGMTNSYYGSMKKVIKNRISGYKATTTNFVNADYMSLTLPYSAGAILSTVEDLLIWQNALKSNNLIKPSSLKKAITPTTLNNEKKIPYGYSFRLSNIGASPVIAHTGSTKGFTSIAIFLPDEDIYIAALSNCSCKNVNKVVKQIAELFVNAPKAALEASNTDASQLKKQSITVSVETLKHYAGTYEVRPNTYLTIGLDNSNQLYLIAPGQTQRIKLFAKTQNHFFMKISNAEITFNTNNNEVISLTMNQSGREIIAKKK